MNDWRPMTPTEALELRKDVCELVDLMFGTLVDQESSRLAVILAALNIAMLFADVTPERALQIEQQLVSLVLPDAVMVGPSGTTIQ